MPAVVFAVEETAQTRVHLEHCYFMLPTEAGKKVTPEMVKRALPGLLIKTPSYDEERGVVMYAYGGAQRIARKGDKRFLPTDEVMFVNQHHPGLLKIVSDSAGPDDTNPILLETAARAERQAALSAAEATQAKAALETTQRQKEAAEQAAAKAALEAASKDDELAQLRAKLAAAEQKLTEKKAVDDAPVTKAAEKAVADKAVDEKTSKK